MTTKSMENLDNKPSESIADVSLDDVSLDTSDIGISSSVVQVLPPSTTIPNNSIAPTGPLRRADDTVLESGSVPESRDRAVKRTGISTGSSKRLPATNEPLSSTDLPPASRRRRVDSKTSLPDDEPIPTPLETRRVVMRPLGRDTIATTTTTNSTTNSVSATLKHGVSRRNRSGGGGAVNALETTPAPVAVTQFRREEQCPILVRMFYSTTGRHHTLATFSCGNLPLDEVQINTWHDATLYELAQELREYCPMARRRGARIAFSSVSPDERSAVGAYRRRQLGIVLSGSGSGPNRSFDVDDEDKSTGKVASSETTGESRDENNDEDEKALPADAGLRNWKPPVDDSALTLLGKGFQIGDYIDVAISEPVGPGFSVGTFPILLSSNNVSGGSGGIGQMETRGPNRRLTTSSTLTGLGGGSAGRSGAGGGLNAAGVGGGGLSSLGRFERRLGARLSSPRRRNQTALGTAASGQRGRGIY